MSGETKITNEFKKLFSMPYFWLRFIFLSLVFAFDDLLLIFTGTPIFPYFIPAIILAGIVFFTFEILALIKIKPAFKAARFPFVLWLIFGGLCVFSECLHGLPMQSLIILLLLPLMTLMGQEENFFNLLLLSCGVAVLSDILAGFLCYPLISNTYSLVLCALVPVVLCGLAWVLLNTRKFYTGLFLILMALIGVMLYLSGVSGGRTGFLTILITILFFVLAVAIKFRAITKGILYKNNSINFAIILAVILIIALTISAAILLDDLGHVPDVPESIENKGIWNKFITALNNGNLLSNRGMIWKYTFRNIRLFGNGPDFYIASPELSAEQVSAHNTYLAVLGHFGPIAFILFMIFCIYMLILSVKYCLASRRLYIFPFIILIAYYVAGITEDLVFIISPRLFSVLFYAACAFLIINEGRRKALP